MSGISLVTKGFIHPITESTTNVGGGGAVPVYRNEESPKPLVRVIDFKIKGEVKDNITESSFKVKSLNIIDQDQKD